MSHAQSEGHVTEDVHVRKKRQVLEHQPKATLLGPCPIQLSPLE